MADEICEPEKKRNLRSPVWNYFDISGGMAICKYCENGKYKIQDNIKHQGTSHLKYHLDKKHPDVVGEWSTFMPSKAVIDHANDCLNHWVVENDQPFTVVEHPQFKSLLRSMNPKNTRIAESVPQSAKVLRENLMACYENELQNMLVSFKSATGQVSFTLDGWTSTNRIPFLGVTGHWIDGNFNLHNKLMGFIHFPVRHTGKNICDAFVALIQRFDLNVLAITMDNASNNNTFSEELEKMSEELGIRFTSQNRVHCFAHVLNLSVQELLKRLKSQPTFDSLEEYLEGRLDETVNTDSNVGNAVSKIRTVVAKIRLSGLREDQLAQLNLSFGIKNVKVVLDVKTRWNSTYAMLTRAMHLKQSLQSLIQTDKDLRKFALTETEWETLNGLLNLLKAFDLATNLISSAKYPTISMVIPAYHWLLEKLNNPTLDAVFEEACTIARGKLQTYQEASNRDVFWIAIALDPTLKMDFIQANYGKPQVKIIKSLVLNVFNTYYENSPIPSTSTLANCEDSAGIYAFYPKRPVKLARGSELLKFFKDDLQAPTTNILNWWKTNEINYPSVAKMARDYLAISGTSVPAERAFSAGTDLIQPKRGGLQADTITAMMSLKLWWKNDDVKTTLCMSKDNNTDI